MSSNRETGSYQYRYREVGAGGGQAARKGILSPEPLLIPKTTGRHLHSNHSLDLATQGQCVITLCWGDRREEGWEGVCF